MTALEDVNALQKVRQKRFSRLQREFTLMREEELRLMQALQLAQQTHLQYQQDLPNLINALFLECMNRLVNQILLQEKKQEETRLRAHLHTLWQKVIEQEAALTDCRAKLHDLHQKLKKEQIKLETIMQLQEIETKALVQEMERQEGKIFNDIALQRFANLKKM